MTSMIRPLLLLALMVLQTSQPPIPSNGKAGGDQQQTAQNPKTDAAQEQPVSPELKAAQPPQAPPAQVVVQQTNGKEDGNSTTQNVISILAVVMAFTVGILQWLVMRSQRNISAKQAKIAEDQKALIETQGKELEVASKEAKRSADAMGRVADSIEDTATTNREIADTQKVVTELASRAYIAVDYGLLMAQKLPPIHFEGRVIATNRGNTPARDFRFRTNIDILPFPTPEDFSFPLADYSPYASRSVIVSGMNKILRAVAPRTYEPAEIEEARIGNSKRLTMWGQIDYVDAFKKDRFVKFAFTIAFTGEVDENNILKSSNADSPHYNDAN